ncbi:uncharacterized protein [Dysidea avara]|uniref:uncharacterized protein n=1 Tax=Dysidea avara TaxID=196820 RepID=UPI0033341EAC
MSHSHLMELSSCQIFNLSVMEQIDAPKDSVLGLYSNTGRAHVALLATDTFPFHINTYQGSGNLDDVIGNVFNDANYNIAIRVHIGTSVVTPSPITMTTATTVTGIIIGENSSSSTTLSPFVTEAVTTTMSSPSVPSGAGAGDGDSSSSVAGVIAGCVMSILVCVAITSVIIFVLWYWKRRKKYVTQDES